MPATKPWSPETPHLVLRPAGWMLRSFLAVTAAFGFAAAFSLAVGMWGRALVYAMWLVIAFGYLRRRAVIDSRGVQVTMLRRRAYMWADLQVRRLPVWRGAGLTITRIADGRRLRLPTRLGLRDLQRSGGPGPDGPNLPTGTT